MNKLLLFSFLLLTNWAVFSQETKGEGKGNKVEQYKIAFITKELNLTTTEAQKFWPLYNEMEEKLKVVRKERRKLNQELTDNYETLKEEEFKKKLELLVANEASEVQIKKEYTEKIAAVIGYKKTSKLINLEQEFKRELLKQLKENSQNTSNKK